MRVWHWISLNSGIVPVAALLAACGGGGGGNPQPVNRAPAALISASSSAGSAPHAVSFSAAASSDQDNNIVSFSWDFDGDGTADSSSAQASFLYGAAGDFTARLTVTDSGGLSDTAELQLSIAAPSFDSVLISAAPETGAVISAGLVDGRPAAAFADDDGSGLVFSLASNENGSAWLNEVSVEDAGAIAHASLSVVAGNPAILFRRSAEQSLRFVRALDAQGSAWGAAVLVADNSHLDSLDLKVLQSGGELLVVFGRSVAFAHDDLLLARASDALGTGWSVDAEPISDINDTAGVFCSAVIGGRPAVALGERSDSDAVLYLRALDAAGAQWPAAPQVVSENFDVFTTGFWLAESAGGPMLVFSAVDFAAPEPETFVFTGTDADGSNFRQRVGLPRLSADDFANHFAIVAGFPMILIDSTSEDNAQLFTFSAVAAGGEIEVLQIADFDIFPATMFELGGRPAVAAVTETGGEYRFIFGT